jgi:hypothetical protein
MNAQEILALVPFPLAAPIDFTKAIGAVFRALPEQPPSEVFARVAPTPTGVVVEFNPAFRPPELRPTLLHAANHHLFSAKADLATLLVQGYRTTPSFRELTDQEVAGFQATNYWKERVRPAAEIEVERHCLLARLAAQHGLDYALHGALLPHAHLVGDGLRARFVLCDDPPGDMFAASPGWFFSAQPGLKALLVQLSMTSDEIEVALRFFV